MSRWFRHYAGMMRDDKLVSVAIRSKQPVERVVWVWGAILESAAELDDDGLFRLDCAEVAYFLRADEADIRAVLDALTAAERVAADHVVKWGDRQFKSDRSAERQAKHRDKKRDEERHDDDQQAHSDGRVTAASRHGDAPETETETELETKPETEKENQKREPAPKRAVRLAGDWSLPFEWRQDAFDAGLSEAEIDREALTMRDWSLSSPDGARKDWRAMWRNWCRRKAAERPRQRAGPARVNPIIEAGNELIRELEAANGKPGREDHRDQLVALGFSGER